MSADFKSFTGPLLYDKPGGFFAGTHKILAMRAVLDKKRLTRSGVLVDGITLGLAVDENLVNGRVTFDKSSSQEGSGCKDAERLHCGEQRVSMEKNGTAG